MTEIIITPERIKYHKVAKYSFKNFDGLRGNREQVVQPAAAYITQNDPQSGTPPPTHTTTEQRTQGSASLSDEDRQALAAIRDRQTEENSLVQQMVKRIEEFSDGMVKMQMGMERQEEEFATRLEETKKRAYAEGLEAGGKQIASELTAQIEVQKEQFSDSLLKLDQAIGEFEKSAGSLEKELSSIALEIAQEVIAKEVKEDGDKIALSLAQSLMGQVKEAMKIRIKVHPEHAATLKNALGSDERIEIVSDRAVNMGGVVILSDAGNINGDVHYRFMAVKKSILEGGHS